MLVSMEQSLTKKNNREKKNIDLPHLPIAPKTEKSAADLAPTLLRKLLNIVSEQASSEPTTFLQQKLRP